MNQQVAY